MPNPTIEELAQQVKEFLNGTTFDGQIMVMLMTAEKKPVLKMITNVPEGARVQYMRAFRKGNLVDA